MPRQRVHAERSLGTRSGSRSREVTEPWCQHSHCPIRLWRIVQDISSRSARSTTGDGRQTLNQNSTEFRHVETPAEHGWERAGSRSSPLGIPLACRAHAPSACRDTRIATPHRREEKPLSQPSRRWPAVRHQLREHCSGTLRGLPVSRATSLRSAPPRAAATAR